MSANFNESTIVLLIALLRKSFPETFSLLETFLIKIAFFTSVVDLQTALNACLTVRDWETLTTAIFLKA